VEGITLEEFLREYEPERRRLAEMAMQILAHVEALHALGIVHGAIHGRNVIVHPNGEVKLTHVSPLLYQEERVDVEATRLLLREMGFEAAERSSLKDLAGSIRPNEAQGDETDGAPEGEHLRRWALIGAIVAAAVGAGAAWMMWRNAERQPREPTAWNAHSYLESPHPNPLPKGEGIKRGIL
jgi:hypothetical protein